MTHGGVFEGAKFGERIQTLEKTTEAADFWNDSAAANKVMAQIKALKRRYDPWKALQGAAGDLEAHLELAREAGEEAEAEDIEHEMRDLDARYRQQLIIEMMPGEVDGSGCFLTVHAGAGGTEACDWSRMVLRMYMRWAERRGFAVEEEDELEAEGGIKSATIKIEGDYVYGRLKGESGVHRLVRISPFDANARRHTSFTSVYVFPVLDDSIDVDIDMNDVRVDTFRSGGKGGQHQNKTDSGVRFTHLPTGIVVSSRSERSQTMNRATCMSMLRAQLYEYYRAKKEEENARFDQEKKDIAFGSQIRSYVFQPYTLVKDTRTKQEMGNIQAVMDGELDPFIESFLKYTWTQAQAPK
jgi:peptide chain release factor 2